MITEDTVYDHDEATQLDETAGKAKENEAAHSPEEAPVKEKKTKGTWKSVAVGTGTGIVFGAAATILTGADAAAANIIEENSGTDNAPQHPLVDDDISMATCVDDEMTFSQAFAAARAEVGPGGVFEWHGQLYGTYTAEEWESMTPEERAEYNDHFAWSSHNNHAGQTAQTVEAQVETEPVADATPPDDDEVNVVDHTEPDVQVLGVVHDADSDMNVGAMVVDGQEVILIDVDNDSVFDVMASDVNGDGQLQANEMVDISDQNLTVNDLGGVMAPGDDLLASNDEPDYINDGGVYEA